LASFGPISAATFGYPAYYVDQNGQGLAACLDPADPLCGLPPLPDPAAPIDIATGNFFDEFLYTFVTADVPMPPNGQPGVPIGLVVYSVLGTFGGPGAARRVHRGSGGAAHDHGQPVRHELLPRRGAGAAARRRGDEPLVRPREEGLGLRQRRG